MENYFEILNVSENAEIEVIKASYKALAKKYHPDSTTTSRADLDKMILINKAFEVLSDRASREKYLQELHRWKQPEEDKCDDKNNDSQKKTSTYQMNEQEVFENIEVWAYKIVGIIIFISLVCCLIYFGPGIWREFLQTVGEQLRDLKRSF